MYIPCKTSFTKRPYGLPYIETIKIIRIRFCNINHSLKLSKKAGNSKTVYLKLCIEIDFLHLGLFLIGRSIGLNL